MRHRRDGLSESFLASPEPDPAPEYSVLLIVAGRMQAESFRYQLASRGFQVDLARSVSAGLERLGGGSYDALVLDWQTLEVEYPGPSGTDIWMRLVRDTRAAAKSMGLVALLDSGQSAQTDIEQAGAIRISRGTASEPHALAGP